jgi:hypothetical protein
VSFHVPFNGPVVKALGIMLAALGICTGRQLMIFTKSASSPRKNEEAKPASPPPPLFGIPKDLNIVGDPMAKSSLLHRVEERTVFGLAVPASSERRPVTVPEINSAMGGAIDSTARGGTCCDERKHDGRG